MKNFNTVIVSAILLGLISVGNAFAADGSINNLVEPAASDNVTLSIENGIATLTGMVEDDYEKQTMETAASVLEGITEVRNYLHTTTPDLTSS